MFGNVTALKTYFSISNTKDLFSKWKKVILLVRWSLCHSIYSLTIGIKYKNLFRTAKNTEYSLKYRIFLPKKMKIDINNRSADRPTDQPTEVTWKMKYLIRGLWSNKCMSQHIENLLFMKQIERPTNRPKLMEQKNLKCNRIKFGCTLKGKSRVFSCPQTTTFHTFKLSLSFSYTMSIFTQKPADNKASLYDTLSFCCSHCDHFCADSKSIPVIVKTKTFTSTM